METYDLFHTISYRATEWFLNRVHVDNDKLDVVIQFETLLHVLVVSQHRVAVNRHHTLSHATASLVFTNMPAQSAAMLVLVFIQWSKNGFFALHGQHIAPMNVKLGTGGPQVPNFTFIGTEMWEYSNHCQNFEFCP